MKIEIDFEVYKALTNKRSSEEETENDVIRELLHLPTRNVQEPLAKSMGAWVSKGVEFPHGTEFRMSHKGKHYEAKVNNGALLLFNKRFDSPSRAAMFIAKTNVNGWIHWECKKPGDSRWVLITKLRKG